MTSRTSLRVPLALGALLAATVAAADTPAPKQATPEQLAAVGASLTAEVALPAYRALAERTAALEEAAAALCAAPSDERLVATQARFREVMHAWQRVRPLAFGPVTWQSRLLRVHFWPDKRGTARRQLQRALHEAAPSLPDAGGLDARSVALQSLSAFEQLVFEQPVQRRQGAYACALAAAVARYQADLAARLLADWEGDDGYAAQIRGAVTGNDTYDWPRGPVADYYRTMVGMLDVIARNKLERPLGLGQGATPDVANPRPKRLESWRSGLSLKNIEANLATIEAVYRGVSPLVAANDAELDRKVVARISALQSRVAAEPALLRDALETEQGVARATELLVSVRALRSQLAGPVGKAVGLGVGFNATDGD